MPDPMPITRGKNDVWLLPHMANRHAHPMADVAAKSAARDGSQPGRLVTRSIRGSLMEWRPK